MGEGQDGSALANGAESLRSARAPDVAERDSLVSLRMLNTAVSSGTPPIEPRPATIRLRSKNRGTPERYLSGLQATALIPVGVQHAPPLLVWTMPLLSPPNPRTPVLPSTAGCDW